jgi:SAM-dependent methyltransferase
VSAPTRDEADGHYVDARLYDHTYARYNVDRAFYRGLAEASGGPVLELGVGTGRIASAIADAGVEVVGVDRMEPMLARARERLAKQPKRVRARVTLHAGDLREVRLERRFALVIAPFNALQHLYSRADVEAGLATVRAHLAAEGRFAFDVLLPDPYSLARDPRRFFKSKPITHPGDGRRYDYAEAFAYDADRQVQTTTIRLQSREGPRRVITDRLSQRQFFPRELEALLHYNGFAVERHDGGFEGEALEEHCDSQVVLARSR